MLARSVVVLLFVFVPALAAAEGGGAPERLVVIVGPGQAGGEEAESLVRVVRSYLADVALQTEAVEAEIPSAPFEDVREAVRAVAAARGASFAVWTSPTRTGATVLSVMHLAGDTVLVRTVDLEDEPPTTLRRTVAAVVRSVVDTGFLQVAARAEQEPAPAGASAAPPAEEVAPTRAWQLGVDGSYGFRWVAEPGPLHQVATLALRARALGWLGLRAAGRLGLGTEPAGRNQQGGAVWRGALVVALGLDRSLGTLSVGVLAGADLEWLRGGVELGESRGQVEIEGWGPGMMARVFVVVRIWRGLVLNAAVETAVRPRRTLFLVRGEPAASSGYVEVGLEIGLGWESGEL